MKRETRTSLSPEVNISEPSKSFRRSVVGPPGGRREQIKGFCYERLGLGLFAALATTKRVPIHRTTSFYFLGGMALFEQVDLPGCATCHNHHDVEPPSDEVLGMHDEAVCNSCQNRGGFRA